MNNQYSKRIRNHIFEAKKVKERNAMAQNLSKNITMKEMTFSRISKEENYHS